MKIIFLIQLCTLLLLPALVNADSTGSTQYAGFKEWKSPNFGIEPDGDGVKVSDLDNDGIIEIVAIAEGYVLIYEHDGATYQEEWRSPILAELLNEIEVGDTDNDGIAEIIVSTHETGNICFYVFGFDGSTYQQEWQSPIFPGDGYDGLHVYTDDSDADEIAEIIITSDEGSNSYIWIFDPNETGYQETWTSGLLGTLEVCDYYGLSDTDNDGSNEMIFNPSNTIGIVGWNGFSYQLEWQSELLGGWVECQASDVDADSIQEIVAFIEESKTCIYKFNGSTYISEWESPDINTSDGLTGDVDNDGIPEIVAGTMDGDVYIYGFNPDPNEYQLEWQTSTPNPYYVSIENVSNFDGEGGAEILVQELRVEDGDDETGNCSVYTYKDSAYQLAWREEKLDSYFGGLLDPAGDVDGDGISEEVRFANNVDRSFSYSIYVIGPAKQMPFCHIPLTGDLNLDCKVNLIDFQIMASEWLLCGLTTGCD